MSPTVVQQVTFSGPRSAPRGRLVPFFTERCVFHLQAEGLEWQLHVRTP